MVSDLVRTKTVRGAVESRPRKEKDMTRQEVAVMMASNMVQTEQEKLKNNIKWLMGNISELNDRLTDDNVEHIAAMLVSELTGSLVADIIRGEARLKEAKYFAGIIDGMVEE